MIRAKTSSSCSPSVEAGCWRITAFLCLAATLGCTTPRLPEDARETFRNGYEAENAGALEEAIIHYSLVLDAYPDLIDARLARGECHRRLALDATGTSRTDHLEQAIRDFTAAAVAAEEIDPDSRVGGRLRQATCLLELEREGEARALLEALLEDTALIGRPRADVHRLLGELMLRDLHRRIAVDHVVASRDRPHLDEIRRARRHFGESLEIDPGSHRSLLGKGIALLHEGLLEESEDYLRRAGEADAGADDQDDAGLLYLLARVRELRLGQNVESNQRFLKALQADVDRDYDPVYVRLYRLLADDPSFRVGSQQTEVLGLLLAYRGPSAEVWTAADAYFSPALGHDPESPALLLGRAVARARLGDAAAASLSFSDWVNRRAIDDPASAVAAIDALELTFEPAPAIDDPVVVGRIRLEKARAYQTLFPGDPDAQKPALRELRGIIGRFEEPGSEAGAKLHGDACALLAEELLALASGPDLDVDSRGALLKEAERLSVAERQVRQNPAAVDFRLARIDLMLAEHSRLELALRAANADPNHADARVYGELAAAYPRLLANEEGLPPEELTQLLDRVRDALRLYRGDTPEICEVVAAIAAAEEQQAEQQRRAAELAATRACPDCGRRVSKTARVCRCGAPLDSP